MKTYVQKLKSGKPFRWTDGLVLAVFCLLCLLPLFIPEQDGEIVRITYEGKTEEYLLKQDKTLVYGEMTVRIADGEVWVLSSDCPTQVCVRKGKISTAGESIICAPNGLVVRVVGDAFDAESGGGV